MTGTQRRKRAISASLPHSLIDYLNTVAENEGLSRSFVITRIVESWIENWPAGADVFIGKATASTKPLKRRRDVDRSQPEIAAP